jgi:tetratricopeptide (TPR) repeat protein
VRAATEVREALTALNDELRPRWGVELSARIGVNTGEVVAGDPTTGQRLVTGDAVNVAARLESAANTGEILIGDPTYRLVRDAVLVESVEPLELKGKSELTTAWRVLGVVTGAVPVSRRLDSPLVGRERELALLRQTLDRAVVDKTCQLVTVLGAAGVGKSRLAAEILRAADEVATVLVGRCLPYGERITFWPVVEIVKRAAGVGAALPDDEVRKRLLAVLADDPEAETIAERLTGLLGAAIAPTSTDEIAWAVRRLLEALGQKRPVVVLFDDIHWAERTFLDLVEHLADWSRDSSLLLICLARPDLLEDRPEWAGGKLNASSLLLEPLDDAASEALIENLLGRIEDAVKERIVEAAEGNPLFVEELLAMLVDEGAVSRVEGVWTAAMDLSELSVPPTIQALLDSRIDRLDPRRRAVLERAAVAGRVFSLAALRVLSPPEERALVDDTLTDLIRTELIRPHQAEFGAANTYRFRHSLIRDAAYGQLSKASRAELHERFAGWLEGSGEPQGAEQQEIIGYHLEQAHRYRAELGGDAREADALARRGAERLATAGRTALARGDSAAAIGLLTRASILLRDDDRTRLPVSLDLGTALWWNRDYERAVGVLDRTRELAAALGQASVESRAVVQRGRAAVYAEQEGAVVRAVADSRAALEVFRDAGDETGLAWAYHVLAIAETRACHFGPAAEFLDEALTHVTRTVDLREAEGIMTHLQYALLFGPTPVSHAISRCESMTAGLTRTPSRRFEAARGGIQAYLEAMRGRFDVARELCDRSKRLFLDLGLVGLLSATHWYAGSIELLAGDPERAEEEVRAALAHDDPERLHIQFPERSALLGEAVLARGNVSEAIRHTETSERFAAPDDVYTQVGWRRVRAQAVALDGRLAEAAALAAEAVRLAETTDSLDLQGDAWLSRAHVARLGADGDPEEAAMRAAALYERKENLAALERARSLGAELARATP